MSTLAGQSLGFIDDGATGYASGMYGQLVDMVLEYVPDLTWPNSIRTYARMRWDPTLQSTLKAYTLPIRRASWAVDPAGCRGEVVEFVADELGLPILGVEPGPSPARRRGVTWSEHIRLSLLDLTFGHMPFERTYTIGSDGRAHIGLLQERMPQTVADIKVTRDGALESITQNLNVPGQASPSIPAQNLVWYAHDKEGTAWMGQSLLRPAYAAWLLKDEVQRVLATSHRRFGMGVPAVSAPPGATASQVAQAANLAVAMRAGDQSGVGLPDGFKFELVGLSGSAPDGLALIRYFDSQMSRSTLTGLLDLGDSSNGSRALGDSFLDLFILSLQSIADEHAATATSQIVVPLVDVNWGEDEPAPRIVCGDVGSEHAVTAQAISDLVSCGAIVPDESLDAFLRGEWKLPPRTGAYVQPAAPGSAPVAAKGRGVRAAGGGQPFRRQPTAVEAAAKTDFAAVQGDWESALDTLVNDWASITKAQRKQILDQIGEAVHDDNLDALAALAVDSQPAAELLAATMSDLAEQAARQQAAEAKAQGVEVDPGTPDHDRLAQSASIVAALLASGLTDGAARKALQVWTPDATSADVVDAVGSWMDDLTDASLRDQLGGGLSLAQGAGRGATLSAAASVGPAARYYASEILDGSVCKNCSAEDGHEFASLDEANAAYASGGYVECLGGLRCRGILIAVWDDAAESQAA